MLSKGVIFFYRCLQSSPEGSRKQCRGDGALPRPVLACRSRSRQREGPRRKLLRKVKVYDLIFLPFVHYFCV